MKSWIAFGGEGETAESESLNGPGHIGLAQSE